MALIPGSVSITGFIATTDSTDTYPVTNPLYGLGGLRSVPDMLSLSAITTQRRELGMIVFVTGNTTYYTLQTGLTNSDWQVLNLTGSTSTGGNLWSARTST